MTVCVKNGGLFLGITKVKLASFRTYPSDRRAKPTGLVFRFPSQQSHQLCVHTTGRRLKNGFPLRSIFLFIFFFLSNNFMLTAGKVITNFVQKPSNQIFYGMTGFLWEIGKPD